MKTHKTLLVALPTLLFPLLSLAIQIPQNIPDELLDNGRYIDPLCIDEVNNATHVTALNHCGVQMKKDRKIAGYNKTFIDAGYIGFNYQWRANRHSQPTQSYSYYKILGKTGNSYVVYSLNNDGRNGQSSSLTLIKREGNTLRIKKIMSGDPLKGGIFTISQQNQKIIYSTYITPEESPWSDGNNANPRQATQAVTINCPPLTTFERDLSHNFENEKLVYIDLDSDTPKLNKPLIAQTTQSCFNDPAKQPPQHLAANELTSFAQTFNSQADPHNHWVFLDINAFLLKKHSPLHLQCYKKINNENVEVLLQDEDNIHPIQITFKQ